MPQPRKYKTDAERQTAYRERKRERDEEMRRELERLKPAKAGKAKRNATIASDDALRQGLRKLHQEMAKWRKRVKTIDSRRKLDELLQFFDYIDNELRRLLQSAS